MDSDGDMIVKRVSVPIGLEELMEGLSKEVLLKKPKDLYEFAAEYFSKLLELRHKGSYKGTSFRNITSGSKHISKEKIEEFMRINIKESEKVNKKRTVRESSTGPDPQRFAYRKTQQPRKTVINIETTTRISRRDTTTQDVKKRSTVSTETRQEHRKQSTSRSSHSSSRRDASNEKNKKISPRESSESKRSSSKESSSRSKKNYSERYSRTSSVTKEKNGSEKSSSSDRSFAKRNAAAAGVVLATATVGGAAIGSKSKTSKSENTETLDNKINENIATTEKRNKQKAKEKTQILRKSADLKDNTLDDSFSDHFSDATPNLEDLLLEDRTSTENSFDILEKSKHSMEIIETISENETIHQCEEVIEIIDGDKRTIIESEEIEIGEGENIKEHENNTTKYASEKESNQIETPRTKTLQKGKKIEEDDNDEEISKSADKIMADKDKKNDTNKSKTTETNKIETDLKNKDELWQEKDINLKQKETEKISSKNENTIDNEKIVYSKNQNANESKKEETTENTNDKNSLKILKDTINVTDNLQKIQNDTLSERKIMEDNKADLNNVNNNQNKIYKDIEDTLEKSMDLKVNENSKAQDAIKVNEKDASKEILEKSKISNEKEDIIKNNVETMNLEDREHQKKSDLDNKKSDEKIVYSKNQNANESKKEKTTEKTNDKTSLKILKDTINVADNLETIQNDTLSESKIIEDNKADLNNVNNNQNKIYKDIEDTLEKSMDLKGNENSIKAQNSIKVNEKDASKEILEKGKISNEKEDIIKNNVETMNLEDREHQKKSELDNKKSDKLKDDKKTTKEEIIVSNDIKKMQEKSPSDGKITEHIISSNKPELNNSSDEHNKISKENNETLEISTNSGEHKTTVIVDDKGKNEKENKSDKDNELNNKKSDITKIINNVTIQKETVNDHLETTSDNKNTEHHTIKTETEINNSNHEQNKESKETIETLDKSANLMDIERKVKSKDPNKIENNEKETEIENKNINFIKNDDNKAQQTESNMSKNETDNKQNNIINETENDTLYQIITKENTSILKNIVKKIEKTFQSKSSSKEDITDKNLTENKTPPTSKSFDEKEVRKEIVEASKEEHDNNRDVLKSTDSKEKENELDILKYPTIEKHDLKMFIHNEQHHVYKENDSHNKPSEILITSDQVNQSSDQILKKEEQERVITPETTVLKSVVNKIDDTVKSTITGKDETDSKQEEDFKENKEEKISKIKNIVNTIENTLTPKSTSQEAKDSNKEEIKNMEENTKKDNTDDTRMDMLKTPDFKYVDGNNKEDVLKYPVVHKPDITSFIQNEQNHVFRHNGIEKKLEKTISDETDSKQENKEEKISIIKNIVNTIENTLRPKSSQEATDSNKEEIKNIDENTKKDNTDEVIKQDRRMDILKTPDFKYVDGNNKEDILKYPVVHKPDITSFIQNEQNHVFRHNDIEKKLEKTTSAGSYLENLEKTVGNEQQIITIEDQNNVKLDHEISEQNNDFIRKKRSIDIEAGHENMDNQETKIKESEINILPTNETKQENDKINSKTIESTDPNNIEKDKFVDSKTTTSLDDSKSPTEESNLDEDLTKSKKKLLKQDSQKKVSFDNNPQIIEVEPSKEIIYNSNSIINVLDKNIDHVEEEIDKLLNTAKSMNDKTKLIKKDVMETEIDDPLNSTTTAGLKRCKTVIDKLDEIDIKPKMSSPDESNGKTKSLDFNELKKEINNATGGDELKNNKENTENNENEEKPIVIGKEDITAFVDTEKRNVFRDGKYIKLSLNDDVASENNEKKIINVENIIIKERTSTQTNKDEKELNEDRKENIGTNNIEKSLTYSVGINKLDTNDIDSKINNNATNEIIKKDTDKKDIINKESNVKKEENTSKDSKINENVNVVKTDSNDEIKQKDNKENTQKVLIVDQEQNKKLEEEHDKVPNRGKRSIDKESEIKDEKQSSKTSKDQEDPNDEKASENNLLKGNKDDNEFEKEDDKKIFDQNQKDIIETKVNKIHTEEAQKDKEQTSIIIHKENKKEIQIDDNVIKSSITDKIKKEFVQENVDTIDGQIIKLQSDELNNEKDKETNKEKKENYPILHHKEGFKENKEKNLELKDAKDINQDSINFDNILVKKEEETSKEINKLNVKSEQDTNKEIKADNIRSVNSKTIESEDTIKENTCIKQKPNYEEVIKKEPIKENTKTEILDTNTETKKKDNITNLEENISITKESVIKEDNEKYENKEEEIFIKPHIEINNKEESSVKNVKEINENNHELEKGNIAAIVKNISTKESIEENKDVLDDKSKEEKTGENKHDIEKPITKQHNEELKNEIVKDDNEITKEEPKKEENIKNNLTKETNELENDTETEVKHIINNDHTKDNKEEEDGENKDIMVKKEEITSFIDNEKSNIFQDGQYIDLKEDDNFGSENDNKKDEIIQNSETVVKEIEKNVIPTDDLKENLLKKQENNNIPIALKIEKGVEEQVKEVKSTNDFKQTKPKEQENQTTKSAKSKYTAKNKDSPRTPKNSETSSDKLSKTKSINKPHIKNKSLSQDNIKVTDALNKQSNTRLKRNKSVDVLKNSKISEHKSRIPTPDKNKRNANNGNNKGNGKDNTSPRLKMGIVDLNKNLTDPDPKEKSPRSALNSKKVGSVNKGELLKNKNDNENKNISSTDKLLKSEVINEETNAEKNPSKKNVDSMENENIEKSEDNTINEKETKMEETLNEENISTTKTKESTNIKNKKETSQVIETIEFEKQNTFDSTKLKQIHEESKLTSFKTSYNPYELQQEIKKTSQETEESIAKENSNTDSKKVTMTDVMAALKIQNTWKKYQLKKSKETNQNITDHQSTTHLKKVKLTDVMAALRIQNNWRKYKLKKSKETKQKTTTRSKTVTMTDVVAALKIQNTWRKYKLQKSKKHDDFQRSALLIQKLWRGFKVRKVKSEGKLFGLMGDDVKIVEELKSPNENVNTNKHHSAASKIQALWRGFKVRDNVLGVQNKLKQIENNDSTDKNKTITEKDIMKAATKIQANTRGYLQRKKFKKSQKKLMAIDEDISKETVNKLTDEEILHTLKQLDKIEVPKDDVVKNKLVRSITVEEPEHKKKIFGLLTKTQSLNIDEGVVVDEDASNIDNNNNFDEKAELTPLEHEVKQAIDSICNTAENKVKNACKPSENNNKQSKIMEHDLNKINSGADPNNVYENAPTRPLTSERDNENKLVNKNNEIKQDNESVNGQEDRPISIDSTDSADTVILNEEFNKDVDINTEVDSEKIYNKFDIATLRRELEEAGLIHQKHFTSFEDDTELYVPINSEEEANLKSRSTESLAPILEKQDSTADDTKTKFINEGVQVDSPNEIHLVHTGEFHDTVVIPLSPRPSRRTKTPDVDEKNEETKNHVDSAMQTTPPRTQAHLSGDGEDSAPPAGPPLLTSPSSGPRAHVALKTKNSESREPSSISELSAPLGMDSSQKTKQRNEIQTLETAKEAKSESEMEVQAATKIQAGFRGYQVRKQLKQKNGSSDINNRRVIRRKSSGRNEQSKIAAQAKIPEKPVQDLEEKSAVKIQAGVRGFLVRRRQKKQQSK